MGLCPFAGNKLLTDDYKGTGEPLNHGVGAHALRLSIVPIMQGTLTGTYEWFLNPASQVSAHFGISDGSDGTPDGQIWQFVDTDSMAWGGDASNTYAIHVEHAGWSGNPLTDAQLDSS